jgi:hypothetical protein
VSTALPLLVALAENGLASRTMLPENAAALVGAGVLSVIVFPALAIRIARSGPRIRPVRHPPRDVGLPRGSQRVTHQSDSETM